MKKYIYNGNAYDTWSECKENFPNVSFPVYEDLTEKILNKYGITTKEVEEPQPPTPPSPTIEEVKQSLVDAVQHYMDAVVQFRNYDNIVSACSYATEWEPNETFKAEGKACVKWRSAVWSYCYEQLALFEKGERTVPSVGELLEELPIINWEEFAEGGND